VGLLPVLAGLPKHAGGNPAGGGKATIKGRNYRHYMRKEPAMSTLDVLSWIAVGLVAGGLIDAITPGRPRGARSAVALAGVAGAVAGGIAVGGLSGMSAVAFLGAVCAAILCAVSLAYLLRRYGAGRYHT
jgi:uncharacterized membrane protein YeaQ/YmgE (transglycosylase-associated protein family)